MTKDASFTNGLDTLSWWKNCWNYSTFRNTFQQNFNILKSFSLISVIFSWKIHFRQNFRKILTKFSDKFQQEFQRNFKKFQRNFSWISVIFQYVIITKKFTFSKVSVNFQQFRWNVPKREIISAKLFHQSTGALDCAHAGHVWLHPNVTIWRKFSIVDLDDSLFKSK